MNAARAISLRLLVPAALALGLGVVSTPQTRADSPVYYSSAGAAISGYDPVAYFTVGRPVAGSGQFAVIWKGAEWHFSSAENQAAFEANPRAYAPQYGGYCAYGLSMGVLSTSAPDAWAIHDGKLYLVHSARLREIWRQDVPGNVTRGNMHWPRVLGRK